MGRDPEGDSAAESGEFAGKSRRRFHHPASPALTLTVPVVLYYGTVALAVLSKADLVPSGLELLAGSSFRGVARRRLSCEEQVGWRWSDQGS